MLSPIPVAGGADWPSLGHVLARGCTEDSGILTQERSVASGVSARGSSQGGGLGTINTTVLLDGHHVRKNRQRGQCVRAREGPVREVLLRCDLPAKPPNQGTSQGMVQDSTVGRGNSKYKGQVHSWSRVRGAVDPGTAWGCNQDCSAVHEGGGPAFLSSSFILCRFGASALMQVPSPLGPRLPSLGWLCRVRSRAGLSP